MRDAARPRIPLPDVTLFDPSALGEAARSAAGLVWRRRFLGESGSVELATRLRSAVPAELAIDAALARLEQDERAHVALIGAFLDRLGVDRPVYTAPPGWRPSIRAAAALTLDGLCLGESIAAARFAHVRAHTDLPLPRACIEAFLRDEVVHAELGFHLLPLLLDRVDGTTLTSVLRGALRRLESEVARDAAHHGPVPAPGPQPAGNPGVVGPGVDAVAFYEAIAGVLPRLDAMGFPASTIWADRLQPGA